MYQQPSRKTTILMSQLAIVFMSVVTSFFPQYYLIAIILYMVVIFVIMSYTTTRKSRPRPEELKNPIFKELKAAKIAMLDKELSKELMKQMKTSMATFVTLPLVFILFPLYMNYLSPIVDSILSQYIENEVFIRFISFLIMYEFIFGVLSLVRMLVSTRYKPINIMFPQQYIVYPTGIYADNRFFVRFSNDQCFKYDPKRHYIEIVSERNPAFKIRLYSENISRLREKLLDKKILRECRQ